MPDPGHADQSTTSARTDEHVTEPRLRTTAARFWSVRWLWIAGIAVLLGDLVTTLYGLGIGLQERNPFVLSVLSDYGPMGLVALKVVALAWVAVIWRGLNRRYGIAAMVGLLIPQSAAVAINVVTILAA